MQCAVKLADKCIHFAELRGVIGILRLTFLIGQPDDLRLGLIDEFIGIFAVSLHRYRKDKIALLSGGKGMENFACEN